MDTLWDNRPMSLFSHVVLLYSNFMSLCSCFLSLCSHFAFFSHAEPLFSRFTPICSCFASLCSCLMSLCSCFVSVSVTFCRWTRTFRCCCWFKNCTWTTVFTLRGDKERLAGWVSCRSRTTLPFLCTDIILHDTTQILHTIENIIGHHWRQQKMQDLFS